MPWTKYYATLKVAYHEMGHAIIAYLHGRFDGKIKIEVSDSAIIGVTRCSFDILDTKKMDGININSIEDISFNTRDYIKDIYLNDHVMFRGELFKQAEIDLAGTMASSKFFGHPGQDIDGDWLVFLIVLREYLDSTPIEKITHEELSLLTNIASNCKFHEEAISFFGGRVACVFSEEPVKKIMDESARYLPGKYFMSLETFEDLVNKTGLDVESVRRKCW